MSEISLPNKAAVHMEGHKQPVGKRIWKYRYYYLFLLPAAFILIYFNFIPTLATVLLAFKNFDPMAGIWASSFNGIENFTNVFSMAISSPWWRIRSS